MANLFDYLSWRGDLTLSQSPFNDVDSLILSTLSYVFFENIVPENMAETISVKEACEAFLSRPREIWKLRDGNDGRLLEELQKHRRFSEICLCGYVNKLDFAAEKQFSALTMLLEDETVFVAYRGTDHSLVGWKEDFNMSFMDEVPAQQEALEYLQTVSAQFPKKKLRIGGHSKGGNLAVYAAAMVPHGVQMSILSVYNHDGPGFRENMLQRAGYQLILPRVATFVPQSSVIGMLMEHEEEFTVVQSTQTGILQHDPYSWEVLGADFVRLENLTEHSLFLDKTVKLWLNGLNEKQRECFIDTIYEAVTMVPVDAFGEALVSPKVVFNALQALSDEDEVTKKLMGDSVKLLLQAGKQAASEYAKLPKLGKWERRNENEK